MSDLLINSLEITGYRTFRHLEMSELGRVNLIVGKNNAGKTALLEALRVFADTARNKTVRAVLQERDELPEVKNYSEEMIWEPPWDIKNLFYGRKDIRKEPVKFSIQVNADAAQLVLVSVEWNRIQHYHDGSSDYVPIEVKDLNGYSNATPSLHIILGGTREVGYELQTLYAKSGSDFGGADTIPVQYIPATGLNSEETSELWDQIALTDSEHLAIDALKLISPEIQSLNFLSKDEIGRIPYVKLTSTTDRINLKNLGEGMSRLLGLALSLASAQGGLLLLDEVETGFHYSIMPKVWRLVFEAATKLNVQVFATTHSWDCIEAFQRADALQNEAEGMLIRLEAKPEKTKVTTFDKESLAIVTREQIEVR